MPTPATAYRIIRHRDRREGVWFDVESLDAAGARTLVASFDSRDDAREYASKAERAAARAADRARLDADFELIRAAHAAGRLQRIRRLVVAAEGLGFWLAANVAGTAADRHAAATALRAARAAAKNF
jgi:hypothetical protein